MSMFRTRVFCMMALILVLVAGSATAGSLSKGVKAGVNLARVTNDFAGDSDHAMGIAAGLSLSYDLVPGFKIQPEILYVQQGGKYDVTLFDTGGMPLGTGELKWKLNYIQVPVLARLEVPVAGAILPAFMGGVAVSFKSGATYELDAAASSDDGDLEDIKSTDLSLIMGMGFKFGAGPAGITVDVRYVKGLNNINDSGTAVEVKNESIQALAGFSF